MKESLLTILRNKNTSLNDFRLATRKLSAIMASEIAKELKQKKIAVETTLSKTQGYILSDDVVLVPILRSGLALLPEFLFYFDQAKVGFLGMRRDEKTAKPLLYYKNLPKLSKDQKILILDPMIATGGSSSLAIKMLLEKGAKESHIFLLGIVAAPEGIREIGKRYPEVKIHVVAIDEKLNRKKFIVPGLGDFGDRFFKTL